MYIDCTYLVALGATPMSAAVERIVVQATPEDKKAIVAKARKLDLPVSELMRRAAFAYSSDESAAELEGLAEQARRAADRGDAIDLPAAAQRIAVMGVTERVWQALTAIIKLEDRVTRQAEAMKLQQQRIEDLTGRVIRLEAQLELLTGVASVRATRGKRDRMLPP